METDSTQDNIKRVLFCTSPLQVINARSVMDYIDSNKKYQDYVILIHPELLESTKKTIKYLAKRLGYTDVIDYTHLIHENKNNYYDLPKFAKIKKIKVVLRDKIIRHQKLEHKISVALQKDIGEIDTIFFRIDYKYVDTLFINTQKNSKWYGIEDGIGDYLPNNWAFKSFNLYEIKHLIKLKFISYFLFLISTLLNWNVRQSKAAILGTKCKYIEGFTNVDVKGFTCIQSHFINNINNLFDFDNKHEKIKVIIIGSLVPDPRFKLDLKREVEIYNSVIKIILEKYKINNDEVWYSHHPRLDYNSWKYKKDKLNCSIYDYNDKPLSDVELTNKHLKAVYSVGSTSLLYAKEIFNIESYLIDFKKEQGHPSKFKMYSDISKIYGIPSVDF